MKVLERLGLDWLAFFAVGLVGVLIGLSLRGLP